RSAARCDVGAVLLVGQVLVAHATHGGDPVPVSLAQLAAQARVHLVGLRNETGRQPELQVGEVEFASARFCAMPRAPCGPRALHATAGGDDDVTKVDM